jgi:hypothetical protein
MNGLHDLVLRLPDELRWIEDVRHVIDDIQGARAFRLRVLDVLRNLTLGIQRAPVDEIGG